MFEAVKATLVRHWTVSPPPRTPEQDEAERYLICIPMLWKPNKYLTVSAIPFNRWLLFFASFLIQFCCGSLYAWSVFNKPIDSLVYNDPKAEKAVNAFYIAVGMFGTTAAILGPWLERSGPRMGMLVGTTSFLLGNLIAALSLGKESIVGVYIGYGIFCGFGLGLNYISPVSALQKWFPDYRGTAAGFAVGGFGAGSVVWGKAYLPTIKAVGLPWTFFLLGSVMAAAMYVSALALRSPPTGFSVGGLDMHGEAVSSGPEDEVAAKKMEGGEEGQQMMAREGQTSATTYKLKEEEESGMGRIKHLPLISCIFSPDFFFLYLMFFANQLFGLMVLSKLSNMTVDLFGKTANDGANVVSVNGVFNCVGRLLLPMASDFSIRFFKLNPAFGRKCVFFFTLLVQAIIVGTLPTVIDDKSYSVFLAQAWILTMLYGGGFGTIPCFLTDMFGAYNIGAMHGFILTSWSIGGVAGGLGFNAAYKKIVKETGQPAEAYKEIFHSILIVLILGFFMLFFVRTNPKDRFAPGYQYSVCDKPVIKIKPRAGREKRDEEERERRPDVHGA